MSSSNAPTVRGTGGSAALRAEPGTQNTRLARRVVYLVAVLALAGGVGLALTSTPPLLVGGALVSAAMGVAVLRWPYVGLLAYMIIFILRLGEVYPQLAPLRMERIVGVVTLASLVLRQLQTERRVYLDASRPTQFLLLTVLAAYVSVPMAYWRMGAIQEALNFVKILVLYLMVVHLVDTRAKLKGFVWLYAALMAYLGTLSIVNYFKGSILHAQGIDRAVGATSAGGGPNEMGASMATTIPLFFLLAFHRRLGGWRWVFMAGLMLLLLTMVFTGSRSALLGFLAAAGYLWWHSRRRVLLGLVGGVIMVGGFFLLPEQYQGRYSTMTESEVAAANNDRIEVWLKGVRMFVHRPLTGVGVGCFGTANAMDFSSGPRRSFLESHSLYVQVPAEMGLVGAVAFFGLLVTYMQLNRRMYRTLGEDDSEDWRFERLVLKAIFLGSLVLLVTGVFGHSMLRRTWYIYAALSVCTWRMYVQHRALLGNRRAS